LAVQVGHDLFLLGGSFLGAGLEGNDPSYLRKTGHKVIRSNILVVEMIPFILEIISYILFVFLPIPEMISFILEVISLIILGFTNKKTAPLAG
jgi:hypothetical protein